MAIRNLAIILGLLPLGAVVARAEPQPAAIAALQAAADRGEPASQFQLARALLRGEGVPQDARQAFDLMTAAAAQGHAEAMGGMGYFYSTGVVVERSQAQAIEWFRKGAAGGSAKAQFNLATTLLGGLANKQATAESGAGRSATIRDEALNWLRKAADQGLAEAALAYGSILYFGDHGVPKDRGQAATYLKLAAEQGFPNAQNLVGVMYETGTGLPLDAAAALRWFRQAAVRGNLKAQSNLGRMLGPLSPQRETRVEAVAWLLLAAEKREVTATKSLEDAVPGLRPGEFEAAQQRAGELRQSLQPTK